jgi:hypothetical protein
MTCGSEILTRLAELAGERDALQEQLDRVRSRSQGRKAELSGLDRLVQWLKDEHRQVDDLTPEERRAAALELGLTVELFPKAAGERYLVHIGTRDERGFFEGVDWEAVGEPADRAEWDRLQTEAQERGIGADAIEAVLAHSADERYFNDFIRDAYLFNKLW